MLDNGTSAKRRLPGGMAVDPPAGYGTLSAVRRRHQSD